MGQDVKLVSQWTNLVNAVAVEVPYGRLAEIQAMDGVESAYVQHVYDRPIEETAPSPRRAPTATATTWWV